MSKYELPNPHGGLEVGPLHFKQFCALELNQLEERGEGAVMGEQEVRKEGGGRR